MQNNNNRMEAELTRLSNLKTTRNIVEAKTIVDGIKERLRTFTPNRHTNVLMQISPSRIMLDKIKLKKYLNYVKNKLRVEEYIKNRRSTVGKTTPWKFKYYPRTNEILANLEKDIEILKFLLLGINNNMNNNLTSSNISAMVRNLQLNRTSMNVTANTAELLTSANYRTPPSTPRRR